MQSEQKPNFCLILNQIEVTNLIKFNLSRKNVLWLNIENRLKSLGKYKIGQKLGSGAFGKVFIDKDNATEGEVAIKVESNRTKHPQLLHEAKLSRKMNE